MGTTLSSNIFGYHNSTDLLLTKLDKNGKILWQKCFGGSRMDSDSKNSNVIYGEDNYFPQHWIEKSNGNFVIVCDTRSNDGDISGFHNSVSNWEDIWIFEINRAGNIIRQKCIGGSGFDIPIELKINYNNSDYLVLGVTDSKDGDILNNYGKLDLALFKIDSSFNIIWKKVIGGPNNEIPASLIVENDGEILVSGVFDSPAPGIDGQIFIYKFDNNGNTIFSKNYGGSLDEGLGESFICPPILKPIGYSEYLFGTVSNSRDGDVKTNFGSYEYWMVKIDSLGKIVWSKVLGTQTSETELIFLNTQKSGEIFAAITVSDSSGNLLNKNFHGNSDIGILTFDTNGNITSYHCLGGSWGDYPMDIYYDSTNNSFTVLGVTMSKNGDIKGQHGNWDTWVVKLKNNISSTEILECKISVYPNPASNYFTIDLNNCISTFPVHLNIFNTIGQLVQSQKINASKSTIELNTGLSKGTYFLNIADSKGKKVGTTKLIHF
jgi:hypothetical protein